MKQTMTRFELDQKTGNGTQVNGTPMKWSMWNLIVTKRDLNLWVKLGMKPNRNWKVSQVKEYFGIKGSGEVLLERFMVIYNENTIHNTNIKND